MSGASRGALVARQRVATLCVCLVALAVSHAHAQVAGREDGTDAIAVRVNGQIVSQRDVEAVFSDSFRQVQEKLRRGELKPEGRAEALRTAWSAAIQTAIQDKLLDQLGAERRALIVRSFVMRADPSTPDDRMMDRFRRLEADEIRRMRQELVDAAGGEKELREQLQRRGQTMQEWEAGLARELFRREVLYSSLGYVANSPAAARVYFEAHRDDFRREDGWLLRRIRVPKERFGSPEAAAKAATLLHEQLTAGADFGAVAAAPGYDPPYDARGGWLTVDNQAGLPSGHFPAEERLAAGLKDGEFSQPVDTGAAWLIVKREGYRAGANPTFEEVADRAAALAFAERVRKAKEEFFARRKRDAFVEVLIPDPPAKYMP